MARKGKPLGNKRQHEQAKARKKREKEARKAARKSGATIDEFGNPIVEEEEVETDSEAINGESPDDTAADATMEPATKREDDTERSSDSQLS